VGRDKFSIAWCQPKVLNLVDGREGGGVVVSTALKGNILEGKNSNQCSCETWENIYLSMVGKEKKER
jgi:hypothetical protein